MSKRIIAKPDIDEYPAYASMYIDLLDDDGEILSHLKNQLDKTKDFFTGLSKKQLKYTYAEGKWTIKEILVHIIDDERIFAYRALRIGRGDATPLPGFEQDDYVPFSHANERSIKDILKEYKSVRKATLTLFKTFYDEDLFRKGIANGFVVSVRALLYHIAGHELHHLNIIKNLYLHKNEK